MTLATLVGAQTLNTLISFTGGNGYTPQASLTLGTDGNFYGTTSAGGSGYGTVFKMTTNGTLTTLYSFTRGLDGESPVAALTLGTDGNFYGTTYIFYEGGNMLYGTVFRVTTNGTLTTLVSFTGSNGAQPVAALTLGTDGNFYGTTEYGGNSIGFNSGYGTVFKMTTNGTLTTLYSFSNGTDGGNPQAALTLGTDGNFYGTTANGGGGNGTVFKVTTNGTLTTLVSYNGSNGQSPVGALTTGNDGSFYGTTSGGGSSSDGTIFKVTTNGILTTLVSFGGTNGENPQAGLTLGTDGNFYGTTYDGGNTNRYNHGTGAYGDGTVFKMTTNGILTTLFLFNGNNGALPFAGLTFGTDGNYYGTTYGGGSTYGVGGSSGFGTVFVLLFPPFITLQPQSQTNNAGANVTFSVNATSLSSQSYQWQKNGTNLIDGGNVYGSTSNMLTITNISDGDAATYSVVVNNADFGVTNIVTLTVIDAPIITTQPTNLMVLPATNVAFGTSLSGSFSFFHYQWQFNNTNILNATNAIYTIASVATNNAGNYSLIVTNAAGGVTSSNAALTVVLSPKSLTNYASSTATFVATAFSPESLNYQWQKNGTILIDGGNILGSTGNTLTVANVQDADAAIYNAVVSDATTGITTSNALLVVNDSLFIAAQPQSQTVLPQTNVTFNVLVYGAAPYVFQWYFNNVPVGSPTTGTNFSSFTVSNVATNQGGNYSVEVVNGNGSITSSNAVLTVAAPPIITTQPLNLTNKANTGFEPSLVVDASLKVLDSLPQLTDAVESFRARRLTPAESKAFAEGAILLRYDDLQVAPVSPDKLLEARRTEDSGSDLWTTFNRVQENLIRGGLKDYTRRKTDGKRHPRTRAVAGLDENVRLNKALWHLAEALKSQALPN